MLLSPPAMSTDLFHFDVETKRFTAEASDLLDLRLGRIFDDAADVGFVLVNPRTGGGITVALSREVKDAEGDLLFTEFTPITATGDRSPVIDSVRIYND